MSGVRMVCSHCGGSDVVRDAWAEWDEEAQEWSLGTIFDHAHCNDCDGKTRLEEKPIEAEQPDPPCPECGQSGCNGECMGDGQMGG